MKIKSKLNQKYNKIKIIIIKYKIYKKMLFHHLITKLMNFRHKL